MHPFSRRLIVLDNHQTANESQRLVALARLLGISVENVWIENLRSSKSLFTDDLQPGTCVLAIHFEILRVLYSEEASFGDLEGLLDGRFPEIFVYGESGSSEINSSIAALTRGDISGVKSGEIQKTCYTWSRDLKEFCAQFAGQSMLVERAETISWFEVRNKDANVEVIMEANERPAFIRLRSPVCQIYVLAGTMPEIDRAVNRERDLEDESIRLIPPLLFFRHCFQESCWHSPVSTARLIIDDPLLVETYGFLDLPALQDSMRRLRYGTSIAFIPWNSWRTSRRKASQFFGANVNLAICIHGCDHTNREFASGSSEMLYAKAVLGMQRMEQHRLRTGIAFEEVMVFPQGKFSKAAIPALRSANYVAAVNSTCLPSDLAPDELKVGDFLWPAMDRFGGFPIFQRRYPCNLSDFAFDLFMGKPAIIVEHHEYFRDRCEAIDQFVSTLHELDPGLTWTGLVTQLVRTHLRKKLGGNALELRFFTRRFQFQSGENDSGHYLLSKHEPDSSIVEGVMVNGKRVPVEFDGRFLRFGMDVRPRQLYDIEILDRTPHPPTVHSFGLAHNAGVLVRRGLSEFRDNALCRHKRLLKVAKRIVKAAKATGDA